MADMWELPVARANDTAPLFTVKHSITNTDYTVRIIAVEELRTGQSILPKAPKLRWVRTDEITKLPLTGLTRKVLRRAGIIQ